MTSKFFIVRWVRDGWHAFRRRHCCEKAHYGVDGVPVDEDTGEEVFLDAKLVDGDASDEYIGADEQSDPNPHKEAETYFEFNDPPLDVDKIRVVLENLQLLNDRIGLNNVKPRSGLQELSRLSTPEEVDCFVACVAKTMGLADCKITLRFGTTGESVGGFVNLGRTGGEIPICVSYSLSDYPASVMAVICHELSHVFLHRFHIAKDTVAENELLTDCTAIFLGFGDIMLNGCTEAFVKVTEQSRCISGQQVGYLKPSQVALAYDIVTKLLGRKVDLHLLDKRGRAILRKSRKDARILGLSAAIRPKKVMKEVERLELQVGELMKQFSYASENLSGVVDYLVHSGGEVSGGIRDILSSIERIGTQSADPKERLAHSIAAISYHDKIDTIGKLTHDIEESVRAFSKLLAVACPYGGLDNLKMKIPDFNIVRCLKCGTKLRLPPNAVVEVNCPKCGRKFDVSTKLPEQLQQCSSVGI